jgi:predicted  nucleic acid-binding Zn-ribbon protein
MKKAAAPEEPSEVADLRHEVSRLEWRIEEKEDDIASLSSALGKAEDRAAKYAKDYAGAQEKYVAANDKLIHCQKALAIIVQSSHGDNDGTMARGIAEEALDAVDAI